MDAEFTDEPEANAVQRRYSVAQICRLLQLAPDRLRRWIRQGLVKPAESGDGIHFFTFPQVTAVKTLWDLSRAGFTSGQIRRGVEQLQNWLPDDAAAPLPCLIERDGRILVRLQEGDLAEPSGQLQLDFLDDAEHVGPVCNRPGKLQTCPTRPSAADCWDRGFAFEQAGNLLDAEKAYRQALFIKGPDPLLCFNLGNVLHGLGLKEQAVERFHQAVELDSGFVEAWNNLGNVLTELGQPERALEAYEHALKLDPHYADLHYNLADTLDRLGRNEEARPHWQVVVTHEAQGRWLQHARRKLGIV